MPAGAARDPNQGRVRQIPLGTGKISGTVVAADSGRPLGRARVSLSGSATVSDGGRGANANPNASAGIAAGRGMSVTIINGVPQPSTGISVSRVIVTDPQGQFSFAKLPAGQYSINVSRDQYLQTSYGQKKPNRPGTLIGLGDGQQLTVRVPMLRGGVITGVVIGQDGEPLMNAQVRAMRYTMVSGFKRLETNGYANTDDRGVYRMFGLQPGEYLVAATQNSSDVSMDRSLADAAAVESAIAAALVQATSAGQPQTITVPMTMPAPGEGGPSGYAPTFYPSASTAIAASSVTVNAGEERGGVDIPVLYNRAGNIQGTVLSSAPLGAVQVSLTAADPTVLAGQGLPSARTNPEGKFTLRNIPPGQYTLNAYTVPAPAQPVMVNGAIQMPVPPPRVDDAQRQWGRVQVTVDGGQAVQDVSVAMQSGKSISGRVMFDTQVQMDLARTRYMVTLQSAPSPQPVPMGQMPQAQVQPDGRFTLDGVPPGRYILRASGGGGATPGSLPIVQKSAIANADDMMDIPLEFAADQDLAGVVITMTDRLTELNGTLTESTGKPGVDYTIIVASAETRFWTPGSRRVVTTRPGADGKYSFRNIPPGEYTIAAVTDLEPGGQYDPEFLKALSGASIHVTLTEGTKKTQDLRVAR
jgi:uncharacterized protein (DUF2141 family)